jgi:putative PIN family toxin of toxin-antitoxin system
MLMRKLPVPEGLVRHPLREVAKDCYLDCTSAMQCWVIDTNVVVSGLINPQGTPARVINAVLEGRLKMVYDARILAEYRDVLFRPRLNLNPKNVSAFLNGLGTQMLVNPTPVEEAAPDPDDLIFVEAALSTPERTIVTGNLAHYPQTILNGARAISPVQSVAELFPSSLK